MAALGFFASQAAAAPTWLPQSPRSNPAEDSKFAQVAVDPSGGVVAVWQSSNGTRTVIEAASHPVGGEWSTPVPISVTAPSASTPEIALDSHGNAIAVWEGTEGAESEIEAATLRAGAAAWSIPVPVSDKFPTLASRARAQVAFDAQGNATALWQVHLRGVAAAIVEAATLPAGGAWSRPTPLSPSSISNPLAQLAVNPSGNAIAIWGRNTGTRQVIEAATHPVGGAWSGATQVSSEQVPDAEQPSVALGPNGNAVAVWHSGPNPNQVIEAASLSAIGVWSRFGPIGKGLVPKVATDPSGNATAVWFRRDTALQRVETATLPAGGSWSTPFTLSDPKLEAASPQVAVDPAGNAVVVFENHPGHWVSEGIVHPAGGNWSSAHPLSDGTQNAFSPQVAVDSSGNAAAIWERTDGTHELIETAAFDASGPAAGDVVIPTTGTVGTPVTFSSPLDAWSDSGNAQWSFGDQGSASGRAVTHTYTTPGTYQVTYTASDSLGNTTNKTGTITIAGPAPAPVQVPPAKNGKAAAAALVKVVKGKALLVLACPKGAPCVGSVKLTTKQVVKHGKKRVKKLVTLAQGKINLRGGAHATVALKLSGKAKALLAAAPKRGLQAQLSGTGVTSRGVRLVAAPKKKGKKGRR